MSNPRAGLPKLTPRIISRVWIQYLTHPTHVGFLQRPGASKKAPSLGQHNYEILEKYGWSKEKIDALQAKWNA